MYHSQTVVNEELGHRLERKDSNKGTLSNVASLQTSTFGSRDPTENMKTEQSDKKLGELSRKDDIGNNIWEDFLTDEEIEKNKRDKEAKTNREVTDDTRPPPSGQSEKESETITNMCNTAEQEGTDDGHDELTEEDCAKKKKRKRKLKKPTLKQAAGGQPTVRPTTRESQPSFSRHGYSTHDRSRQDSKSEDRTRDRSGQDSKSEDKSRDRRRQDSKSEGRTRDRSGQDSKSETRQIPGPKLSRRQRVSPVRRADPVTSEQILHQKIQVCLTNYP